MSLRLVLHQEIPDDENLRRGWNALVLGMESPEVFYTYEWSAAVNLAYHGSLKPLLFLAYGNDDLMGVVSLCQVAGSTDITFLTANTGDYCDFISLPEYYAEFMDLVFTELAKRHATRFVLANLPEDSRTPEALQIAAQKRGFHAFQRPAYSCARVLLGEGEERGKLKATVQKKLHKRLRGLERAGTIGFTHLQSSTSIQPALPDFFDAHAARFHATGRFSSLATAERRAFLEDLARRFSDFGVVTLSMLTINDQPAAWNYGFRFGDSWFWYQPTFDSRWEEHSPGYCLLAKIVMEACGDEKIKVVDLGLGEEGYKERFRNAVRQTLHITVMKSRSQHWMEIMRYRLARGLKRSPEIERMIRRLLGR